MKSRHHQLPGFRLSLGFTLTYLTILLLIPLGACLLKCASLTPSEFLAAVWSPQAQAAYRLTFGVSLVSALACSVFGFLIAWVLARYEFPGKRLFDSLVDLPFALPTAVAGLVYSSLYVENGWLGQFLIPLGIHGAYSRLAIVLVLTFIGLPFAVRTVEPVLRDLDPELEEAARLLGASRWQTFSRVVLPALLPSILTGFSLAFARGLGEYGSVVFVSGNEPFRTEIAPVLIVSRLEAFEYKQAAAMAVTLMAMSFTTLVIINLLQRWSNRAHV